MLFYAEDGDKVSVLHDAGGAGVQFSLEVDGRRAGGHLLLEEGEATRLRDLFNDLYPAVKADRRTVGSTSVHFSSGNGDELAFVHSNRGEPYREGVDVSLDGEGGEYWGRLFLEEGEARRLRDLLNKLFPAEGK